MLPSCWEQMRYFEARWRRGHSNLIIGYARLSEANSGVNSQVEEGAIANEDE